MTIANRLAQLAAEPAPSRCPVCGFDSSDAQAVRACAEREALVESRREAMRVWLGRHDTSLCDCGHSHADHHFPDCDGVEACASRGCACDCFGSTVKPWRDFEGAEPPVDERDWYELLWLAAGVA